MDRSLGIYTTSAATPDVITTSSKSMLIRNGIILPIPLLYNGRGVRVFPGVTIDHLLAKLEQCHITATPSTSKEASKPNTSENGFSQQQKSHGRTSHGNPQNPEVAGLEMANSSVTGK